MRLSPLILASGRARHGSDFEEAARKPVAGDSKARSRFLRSPAESSKTGLRSQARGVRKQGGAKYLFEFQETNVTPVPDRREHRASRDPGTRGWKPANFRPPAVKKFLNSSGLEDGSVGEKRTEGQKKDVRTRSWRSVSSSQADKVTAKKGDRAGAAVRGLAGRTLKTDELCDPRSIERD